MQHWKQLWRISKFVAQHLGTFKCVLQLWGDISTGRRQRHHLEAGNTEAAIRYLHRAGERAVERHAVAEAIEVLQRGLEAIPTLPKSAQRHQLELKLHIAIAMPE
jgi:predicted ATPase